MIKLERPTEAPACIDGDTGAALLAEYKTHKKAVWRIDALKDALLATSHNKCAYCETPLGEGTAYIEVEHFCHKDAYEDLVISWSNLLPSCRRCNGKKGTHDVVREPIINPYEVDPKAHFKFECCRLAPTTELGRETVGVLNLNDTQRLGIPRWRLSDRLKKAISTCEILLERYKGSPKTRTKNNLLEKIEDVLTECQPTSSYSAVAATVLHSDPTYYSLMEQVKDLGFWTSDLETMHAESRGIALEVQGLVE
ncbi:HNH endonuclease [Alcaligenes sp. RM2]